VKNVQKKYYIPNINKKLTNKCLTYPFKYFIHLSITVLYVHNKRYLSKKSMRS